MTPLIGSGSRLIHDNEEDDEDVENENTVNYRAMKWKMDGKVSKEQSDVVNGDLQAVYITGASLPAR